MENNVATTTKRRKAANKMGYKEVKSLIRKRIQTREWKPGDIIPTEFELAEELGCARATVNRAMRELAEEGIVERRRKMGTRVARAPMRKVRLEIPVVKMEIESVGAQYRYSLVSRAVNAPPAWLRTQLMLPDDARMLNLQAMHYKDNAPFQFESRWINLDTVPEAENIDFSQISANEWLVQEVAFDDVDAQFYAYAADVELSEFLQVSPGDAIFAVERSTWFDGVLVTHAKLFHHPGYRMNTRY